jgi:hypothetical protein
VGVTRDVLPEGDWYCPECVRDNANGKWKLSSPLQDGELLGIDPLGCAYLATCGDLLLLTSYDGSSCHYYRKNDLQLVIEMQKSSDFVCDDIVYAISMHLEAPVDSTNAEGAIPEGSNSLNDINMSNQNDSSPLFLVPLPSSIQDLVKDDVTAVGK